MFTGWTVTLLLLSALGSAFGNLLLVLANRTTPAGVIAPLIYSQLIAAMVLGLTIFGEWPEPTAFVGVAIVIGAGVYIFMREGSKPAPHPIPPGETR